MIPFDWLQRARERISPYIVQTPLSRDQERDLYLKWDNRQVTGSFKARGALNKVLSLQEWEREAGLVAASAGNHGLGVALAGRLTRTRVEVFVPAHAAPVKVEAMQAHGATVHLVEGGYGEAEAAGKRYAETEHKTYISPYNDAQVIAGQGTVALEIVHQLEALRPQRSEGGDSSSRRVTWIVPTGGGGLISACGIVVEQFDPAASLVGVQAAASAFTHSLFHSNTQRDVEDGPTLADGLSGAIDDDSVTIPLMREYVDDILLVSEESIARAIAFAWNVYHERIEGSGAAGLAAILDGQIKTRPCVLVVTGGNIEDAVFDTIQQTHSGERWI